MTLLSPFAERQMIEKSMNTGYDISEKRVLPDRRRSALKIMGSLIGLVKPLIHIMILAVLLGTAGYLCAIFLTILAGQILIQGLGHVAGTQGAMSQGLFAGMTPQNLFVLMIVLAVARGILHYAEQYCNHFIAFKLLALIRDKVFGALRRLCPAKLEGRDKGDLINVITSDIELLEVFYAHTISPVCIAVLYSAGMVWFIGSYHWGLGLLALAAYMVVGAVIPLLTSRYSGEDGMSFRTGAGQLAGFVLDSLRGLSETLQYGQGAARLEQMDRMTDRLSEEEARLKRTAGRNAAATNLVILLFDLAMLFLSARLCGFSGCLITTLALMSSFGPCVALAALGSTLQNTFAAGNRVLDILEESPVVEEVTGQPEVEFSGAASQNVSFAYQGEPVLKDLSLVIPPHQVVGIVGRSRCSSCLCASGRCSRDRSGYRIGMWTRSIQQISVRWRAMSRRRPICSTTASAITCALQSWMPPIRRSRRPAKRRRCMTLSLHCPRDMTPRWESWATRYPAASGSVWGWHGRFCTMHRLCCWTNPPATWTA